MKTQNEEYKDFDVYGFNVLKSCFYAHASQGLEQMPAFSADDQRSAEELL